MTITTSSGQPITDQQITAYFAHHPATDDIARDAAALGLDATAIAYAVSLGWGQPVSADAVRDWVASSGTYTWDASGMLDALFTVSPPLSGSLDTSSRPGHAYVDLHSGAGTASITGLASGSTIESDAAGAGTLSLQLANASGNNDALTLKLDAAASANFGTVNAGGVETLAIDSTTTNPNPTSVTNTVVLSATAQTTLAISGDAALDLSTAAQVALLSVKNVDAQAFDAGLDVYLYGNTNDLSIHVGDGNNIVVAGFGNDTISTGAGNDIIFSGRASDVVDAGAGNDWIRGGPAADVMTGGPGVDTFAYVFAYESSQATGVDTITDFTGGAGGDILDFTALTHGSGSFAGSYANLGAATAALAHGTVHAVVDASTNTLWVDLDANGALDATNDIAIHLTGIGYSLTAANFLF